jgi:threonine 3-dehydrogenase
MKALIYDKNKGGWENTHGLWQIDLEKPVLSENDSENVIIKMKYAGFCGSDKGIWNRKAFGPMIESSLTKENKQQRIIGHELLGQIVEAGKIAQEKYNLKAGDVVSAESHITCGKCYQCSQGNYHVCADDIIIGISQDGCFAEYAKLPAKILWKTDIEKIDPRIGAIQEPFGNAVHACSKVDIKNKTVAIFGCGAIGSLCVMVAKGMGAKSIIVTDPHQSNLDLAINLGADHTVLLDRSIQKNDAWEIDKEVVEKIRSLTDGGMGVDVALEMSGPNSSINSALRTVCRGGNVVLFGLKSGNFIIKDFEKIIRDGISMHSVIGRRIWDTWHITKRLLEDPSTGVQEKIKNYILKNFEGPIIKFSEFDRDIFEQKLKEYPKLIFEF